MYDKLRDHHHWVLAEVLAYQAAVRGDKPYITMVGGESLTYAEAQSAAAKVAGFMSDLGVRAGDTVAVMMPNGLDYVRVWLGLGRLGAVMVALNTGLKGAFLEHQLNNSGARVAIFHESHLDVLLDVALRVPDISTVVVAKDTPSGSIADCGGWQTVAFEGWADALAHDGPQPRYTDTASIIYTSGTTGPSKGVLIPHAHSYLFGLGMIDNHAMTEDDVFYVAMPMFHINGLYLQLYAALIAGASVVMRPRFSASNWLDDIRRFGATITNALGAMATFVFAAPETPYDKDHRLRIIQTAPNPPEHDQIWRGRFGIAEVLSGFGMTEVNLPVYGRMGHSKPGTAGLVYDRYFELEIRDPETDEPVAPGMVGEIMVRPKLPFGFMAGYHRMPDKTVEAWRNFWFHTGDAGTKDAEGFVTFIDRIKDCIRRRGENISSFEVEAAISTMPGVKEVAAFAVPADLPGAEDEVMLAVVPLPGAAIRALDVAAFADGCLPRFAQPRYIEIVETLPRTPTEKVQKNKLRARGVGVHTWDRLA
jgi:crotonobetaine/carnitine-CoA ligase